MKAELSMATSWLNVLSVIEARGPRWLTAASRLRMRDELADSRGEAFPCEGVLRKIARFAIPFILAISAGLAFCALFRFHQIAGLVHHWKNSLGLLGVRRALSRAVKPGETCRFGEPERLLESFQRLHNEPLVLDKAMSNAE